MRPPKNFDNKMNRRKQLLPEVPQATADDYGKVLGVDSNGGWELKNQSAFTIKRNDSLQPYVPNIDELNNYLNNNIIPTFVYRTDLFFATAIYAGYVLIGRFEFFTNYIFFTEMRIDRTTGDCTVTNRSVAFK